MTIYDDCNVVVPIGLLKSVITTHILRPKFHLRIEFGNAGRIENPAKVLSFVQDLPNVIGIFIYYHRNLYSNEPIQELRSYLVANNLKHIVLKGANNEDDLTKKENVELIKVAYSYLIVQHGPHPKLAERKQLATKVCTLFPRLNYETVLKKLSQRGTNFNRKAQKEQQIRNRSIDVRDKTTAETENFDFEQALEVHNIAKPVQDDANGDEKAEYIDEEYIIDEY